VKFTVSLAVAAVALIAGVPVKAGVPYASYSDAQRHEVLLSFATCLVDTEKQAATDYVFGKREKDSKAFSDKSSYKCAERSLGPEFLKIKIPSDVMLGALSEVLLGTLNLAEIDQLIAASPAPEPSRLMVAGDIKAPSKSAQQKMIADLPRMNSIIVLGNAIDCTIQKNPARSRAVFAPKAGSPEEASAINAVLPTVAKCLGGRDLRIRPDTLRSMFATRYLRMADQVVPDFRKKFV
jgi:hypothetical protein